MHSIYRLDILRKYVHVIYRKVIKFTCASILLEALVLFLVRGLIVRLIWKITYQERRNIFQNTENNVPLGITGDKLFSVVAYHMAEDRSHSESYSFEIGSELLLLLKKLSIERTSITSTYVLIRVNRFSKSSISSL